MNYKEKGEILLKEIVETTRLVSVNSKHVKINYEELNKLTLKIKSINNSYWLFELNEKIKNMNLRDIINFLFIMHITGFSYWGEPKWEIKIKGMKYDGSLAMIESLISNLDKIQINNLKTLSYSDYSKILKGNIEIPLLRERYEFLREATEVLKKEKKDFYDIVDGMNTDTELLGIITDKFDSFKDESIYEGMTVKYYKRAQLLVSDILHVLKFKKDINVDYSNLIGCADYKIPQVLRNIEIFTYDGELSYIIDNKKEIKRDSIYENEIRANTIVVIKYLADKINNINLPSIEINDQIWLQGQNCKLDIKPYHRTRTTNY